MENTKLIQEFPTLQLYFHTLVNQAMEHHQMETDAHVPFYVVHLLSEFSNPNYLAKDESGEPISLAVLFCKAQQESPEVKTRLLKQLGDISLMVSGFFQESLNRKLVDLDYYIAMGGGAYHQLSMMGHFQKNNEVFQKIFSDLSSRFVKWMDVLSEVSEVSHVNTYQDTLRLYERFLKTGSEHLQGLLSKKGIFANVEWQSQEIQ
jgi:hypothetical protein